MAPLHWRWLRVAATSVLGAGWACLAAAIADAASLQTFSYPLPPFTYEDGDRITGPLTRVVAELTKAAGLPAPAVSIPVARLLVEVEQGGGVGFPLARNSEREPHFQWIVELYRDSFGFATLASVGKIDSLAGARQLNRITVNRDSAPFNFLTAIGGFANLDIANSELQNAAKLFGGRSEAWFSVRSGFRPIARLHGFDPQQIMIGDPIDHVSAWLIGPRSLPEPTVAAIRSRFDQLKTSGDYDLIMNEAR